MSGHIKWTDIRHPRMDWAEIASVVPHQMELTRFWVQGYILAIKDMIHDLETSTSGKIMDFYEDLQSTLASAQRTLDAINKIIKEDHGGEDMGADQG